ncbi:MAG: hypothetical protein IJB97_03740 [Clostridia bacterium]|nr:hypothetical protein [Clostridia bacterium]
MKKITSIILSALCLPVVAFCGCSSKAVEYRLTDGDDEIASTPALRDHQSLGSLDLEAGGALVDMQKPKITVKGDYSQGLEATSAYIAAPTVVVSDDQDGSPFLYVTATDANGETVRFTNDGRFFVSTLGAYTFRYNCVDASENIADEVVLNVEVKDTQAPSINLRSFEDGISGLRFNTVKIPSVIVNDYYECDLKVEVGKADTGVFEEIDRYALVYKPQEVGEYVVRYTATEQSEKKRVSVAEIALTVEEKTLMSACEDNVLAGWGFSDPTATAKPQKAVDTALKTEGNGSTKFTFFGGAAQENIAATTYKDENGNSYAFRGGVTAYLDFLREGSDDVSGYTYVKIDIYNANETAQKVQLWVQDQNTPRGAAKANPVTLAPNAWTTVSLAVDDIVAKGADAEALLSILLTFEAHTSGTWIFYADNFRVE